MNHKLALILIACSVVPIAQAEQTRQAGDWLIRGGIGVVDPKSDNLTLQGGGEVSVDEGVAGYLSGTYFITDSIGIELLASTPFEHDIAVDGMDIGSTDQLPPTISVQWHAPAVGPLLPYFGPGLNWTLFFSEDSTLGDLDLDSSFGLALQAGVDVPINENWFVNVDLRWIDIDTDASIDGTDIGTVEIDPIVYAFNVGYKF